jgi:hypothetical protein
MRRGLSKIAGPDIARADAGFYRAAAEFKYSCSEPRIDGTVLRH